MPESLWKKYFGQKNPGLERAKARLDPLLYSTWRYSECQIAMDLHMSLAQYQRLPRKERFTWYLFKILAGEKEQAAYDKAEREREMNTPSSVPELSRFRE